jgi:hypothetical protein
LALWSDSSTVESWRTSWKPIFGAQDWVLKSCGIPIMSFIPQLVSFRMVTWVFKSPSHSWEANSAMKALRELQRTMVAARSHHLVGLLKSQVGELWHNLPRRDHPVDRNPLFVELFEEPQWWDPHW